MWQSRATEEKAGGAPSDRSAGNGGISSAATAQGAELNGVPYQARMEAGFGQDFSGVQVQLGASMGTHHAHALASQELVQFAETQPSPTRVAHELAHVVQFRRHGSPPPAARTQPDDASEIEARQAADVVAGGGRFDVQAAPTAQVALDARTDLDAGTLAWQVYKALTGREGGPADAVATLKPWASQPKRLRAIRAKYWSVHSHVLESDCHSAMSTAQYQTVYGWLRPALTLAERIEHEWYWQGVRGEGIIRIIEGASTADRNHCADDATERKRFEKCMARLAVDVQFRARLKVYRPEQALIAVKARITAATAWSNDYSSMFNAVLRLPPAQRKQLSDEIDNGKIAGLSAWEKDVLGRMCSANGQAVTEQTTLDVRMSAATSELTGTDDAGVADLAQITGERVAEEQALRAKKTRGRLTEAESKRLEALGYLDPTTLPDEERSKALLYAKRGDDGALDSSCFLGKLRGDVGLSEWISYCSTMGVEPFEICKERMLAAKGEWLWDDEDAIFKAIDDLLASVNSRSPRPTTAAVLRVRLWRDPHLNPLLQRVAVDHADDMHTHLQISGSLALHVKRIKTHWEGMSVDVTGLLREIMSMSADDRAAFLKHGYYEKKLAPSKWTGPLGDLVRATLETGRMPTDAALKWAQGGWADGTDEDVVMLALDTADDATRAQYRMGYWLSRTKRQPQSAEQKTALAVFKTLEADLGAELSEADLHKALGKAIGPPRMSDFKDADRRKMAAEMLYHRQKEGVAMSEWAAANLMTSADENLHAAHTVFAGQYEAFMADGEISADELKVLGFLDNQFKAAAEEYTEASAMISDIASTIAAVAAGVIITIALPGLGAAVTAMIAAAGGGASKALAAEAFAGRQSDLLGGDGAMNFAVGAVDGALAVASAGIAEKATKMVGLSGKALKTGLINATVKGTETGASVLKRRVAAGVVEGIVDGALSGAGNELLMTALDAEVWHQNMWQVMTSMGAALVRGGGLGMGTGAVFGGVTQGVTALADLRKMKNLKVQEVQDLGSTASVVYRKDGDAIVDIQLKVGPDVSVPDIERHLDVVDALKRYGPLRQRLRGLMGKTRKFDASDEAGLEVFKHQKMIEDRLARLKSGAVSADEAEQLVQEIRTFERAIEEFEVARVQGKGLAPKGEVNSTKALSPEQTKRIRDIEQSYRAKIDAAEAKGLTAQDKIRYERYKEVCAIEGRIPLGKKSWQTKTDRLRELTQRGREIEERVLQKLNLKNNNSKGQFAQHDFKDAKTNRNVTTRADAIAEGYVVEVKFISEQSQREVLFDSSQLRAQRDQAKHGNLKHVLIMTSDSVTAKKVAQPKCRPSGPVGKKSFVVFFQGDDLSHYWDRYKSKWVAF